jgi:hypothetical protein
VTAPPYPTCSGKLRCPELLQGMMARCLLVLAVGLCDSGGDAPADVGQVRGDFSAPSRCVLVRGWKGNAKVRHADLTFEESGVLKLNWTAKMPNSPYSWSSMHRYSLDPHSGLPVLSWTPPSDALPLTRPSVRMMGNYLQLKMPHEPLPCLNVGIHNLPTGTLHLILRRVPEKPIRPLP